MARTTFDQDIFVAASPTIVRERLIKLMTDVTELHPFVIWTRHIRTTAAADGAPVEHYLVRDRMKLGPFTLAFTYRVEMTASAEGKLVSHAYQSPGIHLFNTTWCEPTANGTLIREHIDITAPCLLMKTTYKGAATAHKEMLARLKEAAEQAQTLAR
ncbi:MAG TPA: SRPBCC family protein [Ktedonobacteraceae bacterium]|jgi:hypothetical protein|nr:SRPBCC family protein [Ktedonobacteraceae bacterium]